MVKMTLKKPSYTLDVDNAFRKFKVNILYHIVMDITLITKELSI